MSLSVPTSDSSSSSSGYGDSDDGDGVALATPPPRPFRVAVCFGGGEEGDKMRAAARAYMRISIAGPIGVGKTTLAKSLALELDVPFVPEPHTENPYFDDFYQNREEYAFRAQLTFMMHRIQHHISMRDDPQFRAGFVQERSAFEDRVFAERMLRQGDMDKRDFELYDGFYNVFARAHGEEVPDAIVVLDADVGTLLQRIRARARPGEDIDKAYLASFDEHYEAFVERMAKMTTVFRVNWNTERPQVSMQDTARKLLAEMEDACGSGKGVVVISV